MNESVCGSRLLTDRVDVFAKSQRPDIFGETLRHVANEWMHGRPVDIDLVHLLRKQLHNLGDEGDFEAAVLAIAFSNLLLRRPDLHQARLAHPMSA